MKSFVRMTKLTNIINRADYISSEKRQEHIVLKSAPIDWSEYVEFEKANQKSDTANNEGRELIIALPNEFATLELDELKKRTDLIAAAVTRKDTNEIQYAVHWNSVKSNLHMHVIFSERSKNLNFVNSDKRWERNIYLTAEGKVARTKKDRATDKDGNYLVKHKKGELKAQKFTAKDKIYTLRNYSQQTINVLELLMKSKWDVKFDDKAYIHQFHEGKGQNKDTEAIKAKNTLIRLTSAKIDKFAKKYALSQAQIKNLVKDSLILIHQLQEPCLRFSKNQVFVITVEERENLFFEQQKKSLLSKQCPQEERKQSIIEQLRKPIQNQPSKSKNKKKSKNKSTNLEEL